VTRSLGPRLPRTTAGGGPARPTRGAPRAPATLRRRPDRHGFTLIETVVALSVLGILAVTALGGVLFGLAQAHRDLNRSAAAVWGQAELDYLRAAGYSALTPGTRTLTPTSGYSSYGNLAEPRIPAGFDHATVAVQTVGSLPLLQLTATLYDTATQVDSTYATDLSNFTHP
jgi:prepilin-type N-terminal cleavage/methylation domain-containing protein